MARNSVVAIIKNLEELKAKVEKYLETASDDRANELENEVECLEMAIESLENID